MFSFLADGDHAKTFKRKSILSIETGIALKKQGQTKKSIFIEQISRP